MYNVTDILRSDIILSNNAVSLVPLTWRHLKEFYPVINDEEIYKYSTEPIYNTNDLVNYFSKALRERISGFTYPFSIIDNKSSKFAGTTRFANISIPDNRAEIGWTMFFKDFRGSGLNKSCKHLLLQFAFNDLLLERVEFKIDAINSRSRKAIAKIGANEEGILKSHIQLENRRRDTVYYSILRQDWDKIEAEFFPEFL